MPGQHVTTLMKKSKEENGINVKEEDNWFFRGASKPPPVLPNHTNYLPTATEQCPVCYES